MDAEGNTDTGFLNRANRNWIALGIALATLALYWVMLSPTAFPGSSANLTSVCLGLEPRLAPGHPLWMSCVLSARLLPAGVAVYALNLWSALCGALSVALLFRFLSRWVEKRIVLDDGLTERAPQIAALAAGLTGAFAFATSLPLWVASTRLNVLTFHALLLVLAFNLLQDNQDRADIWRPFALALLCGVGCAESALFLLMTPFFTAMLLMSLYARGQCTWGRIAGVALTGLAGTTMYGWAATQFAGSEGFVLAGYSGRLAVVGRMLMLQLAELRELLPRSGWIWVLILVYLPWLAVQFEARNGFSRRREAASMVFHAVLILLVLPVQFNSSSLPWSANLPEGRLPVLEMLLTAMTLGYLTSFWSLCFMDSPELSEDDDPLSRNKTRDAKNISKALRQTAGAVALLLVLLITAAAVLNAAPASGRGGRFMDSYAHTLLDQLKPDSWLVTDGLIDTNLRLAARERGQKIQLISLPSERHPLQIRQLCKVLETDPAFAGERIRYLNAARLGCVALLQEWLVTDPADAAERLVFYAPPDLLFEAGLTAQADRLVFRGVKEIEALRSRPLLEEHRLFWAEMQELLDGPVKGVPVNALRGVLRRHVSMAANNLGVLLEDLERREEAGSAYLQALEFDAENFSAKLNRVVLTRKGAATAAQEAAELEAAEALRALKHRPDSGRLARFYGYVRVPSEFARQSSEWMRFGQPRMAEASLKRALDLARPGTENLFLQELAFIHLSNSRPDEGEAAYRQVLENAPADHGALMGMVRVASMRQDYQAAREWLAKADKAGVLNRHISLEQARIEIAEGSYAQAQRRLQALTDGDAAWLEAWALQANLLIAQNRADEAERDILPRMKKVSLDSPRYITALTEANILRAKGPAFFKPARESFLLALRLQPGSRSVLSEILKLDFAVNDLPSAERHAAALLRLDRDDGMANYVMGSILVERGELEGAEEYLRRAVTAGPTTSNCNDLAEVLRLLKKLPEAEQSARRALELKAENPFACDTLACVLLDAGRIDEALAASVKAREFLPDLAAFKLTAARILEARGDKVESRVLVHELRRRRAELSATQWRELEALSSSSGPASVQL